MTNSRLTDPEILERRFPVRLERFAIRRGSGGAGEAGGDGAVRRIRFLAPMEAALFSTRREHAPQGVAGGGPAQAGRQRLIRADGTQDVLPGCFSVRWQPATSSRSPRRAAAGTARRTAGFDRGRPRRYISAGDAVRPPESRA